jgi:glycine/D-amino acid oxidase-like deaminating enzyme/Rieske Fe-S protein
METVVGKPEEAEKTSGTHPSYWKDSEKMMQLEKLETNLDTDVVIVGGGIAGVTTAYCLSRSGKKVILIEDGELASGETGRTTAHLSTCLDERYYTFEKKAGKRKTKLIAQSHAQAIDFIENVIHNHGIECDFERLNGYLFPDPSDKEENLAKEFEAAKRAGLEVTELKNVPGIEFEKSPCIRFSKQAQFHPLKYLNALCNSILESGGQIYTNTHVAEIDKSGVQTENGFKVSARHIVVTTNSPVNNKFFLHLRQNGYRTYVIGAKIVKTKNPKALWWDTGHEEKGTTVSPYHYVRIQELDDDLYDLLICGGEDHSTGVNKEEKSPGEERYEALEKWARERFEIEEIIYKWSGQVMEPVDTLAFIGRNPTDRNVYVATGFSGNGMTYGTISGIMLTDLINGKKNKYEEIYNPSRFNLITTGKIFVEKLMEMISAYINPKVEDKTKGDRIEELKPLEGKVIEMGGIKYGVFRDEKNFIHMVSTECTHLHCTVSFNQDEKSWDCPCHGSRFTYKGKVINGPANENLFYHKLNGSDIFQHVSPKIKSNEIH